MSLYLKTFFLGFFIFFANQSLSLDPDNFIMADMDKEINWPWLDQKLNMVKNWAFEDMGLGYKRIDFLSASGVLLFSVFFFDPTSWLSDYLVDSGLSFLLEDYVTTNQKGPLLAFFESMFLLKFFKILRGLNE